MSDKREKRASERRCRTVIGGREGSKEGIEDGDGEGGHEKSGSGFAFGRLSEKRKVGEGVPQEPNANLKSGSSQLSYRDKLLSPGCVGFLLKHAEEDDIVQVWKDYFHRMNEKDTSGRVAETDKDEDEEQTMRRLEGRTGALNFTAKEYTTWCLPWINSLIIKVMGATFPTYIFRDRINPWIRLLDVPFEFYDVESLRRIGNMVGEMIKVDRSTSIYDKGGFARICVELDLQQPLLPSYMVFGEERPIIYKALHQVCFLCGKYGHKKDTCQTGSKTDEVLLEDQATMASDLEEKRGGKRTKEIAAGGGATIVTGDENSDTSPFGKIKILRRNFQGVAPMAGLKHGVKNANKGQLTNDKAPRKSEWVQVGAKRKSDNKRKLKGNESRKPARDIHSSSHVGPGVNAIKGNVFEVLQLLESGTSIAKLSQRPTVVEPSIDLSTNKSVMHGNNDQLSHAPPLSNSTLCMVLPENELQAQDDNPTLQDNEDAQMFGQDKTEGEGAIPQPSTVSQ
ncbi:hypothetical protein K1719_006708 [Acacia pycnantha]|nr:hypothetical protein K1719_006708 [Acacia pycnantha]